MATTTATPNSANGQDNSGALSQEKVTYRGYAKFDDKGVITDFQAKGESAKNAAWDKLEKSGYTLLNSNEGFQLLIPELEQRLYIVQAGLNYLQNSKANGFMQERQEGAGNENSPKYNDQVIDLR